MQRKVHPCVDVKDGPVTGWMIQCPACFTGHQFRANVWTFDGNLEEPTFSPSMLVRYTINPPEDPTTDDFARGLDGKYLLGPDGRLAGAKDAACHSFVRNGKIEFLGDCTHDMAGQTVDLPIW